MQMKKPSHPGALILEALAGMTISDAAKHMGVARASLSRIVNGHASVSPDMAYRLGKFLGTSTELWLNLQRQYDVWAVDNRKSQPTIIPRM